MEIKIAPSLLAADFARLGEEISIVESDADMLHLDVMDGHFVPNISFGLPVIESIRPVTDLTFDCHVMTTNPEVYLEEFKRVGADVVTMHIEAVPDPTSAFRRAAELDLDLGLVVSPPTPFEAVVPWIEKCRMVVVMSVHPGFGGQAFITDVLEKVAQARKWVDSHDLFADIQIDGGITVETARQAAMAGANVLVAGSAVFRQNDPAGAIRGIRGAVGEES